MTADPRHAVESGDRDPTTVPVTDRTTLILVRHVQTTWGAEGRYVGRQDVPLSPLGREQLELLARRLTTWSPSAVLTSPLNRCMATAEAVAAPLGLTPQPDTGLLDGTLGEWAGHHPEEIAERWPREFARWRDDPDAAPPGGESFTAMRERMGAALSRIVRTHRGGTAVLVSHAAPIKMVCVWAVDAPTRVAYRTRIDNASITVVEVDSDDRAVLVTANDTGHLEPLLGR